MAKTYPGIGPFAPGDILNAATMTDIETNLDNQRVPPLVRVYRNAALNHTSSGNSQAVSWDDEYITQTDSGMWAVSPNPTRIVFKTAGVYQVSGAICFSANASGIRILSCFQNNSTTIYNSQFAPSSASATTMPFAFLANAAANDFIEMLAFQNTGGNLAYVVGPLTSCSVAWVGQAS